MITVITGQPGNGKTLFTLGLVDELRAKAELEGKARPIFYSGIPELTLPWSELSDPQLWNEAPDGAVIVLDECQRVFPPRKQGAQVPAHVQALETHRHRGIDIFLITQHPQLVDIAVRKLAGRHLHLTRTFGQEVAKVRQWERCVDPHDRSVQSIALTSSFTFPKERYAWYKSAELHTVKKQLPWKKFAVLSGCLLGVVGFGWLAAHQLMAKADQAEEVGKGFDQAKPVSSGASSSSRSFAPQMLKPELSSWPWSAPFYDQVVKVRAAPRVSGCYSMRWSDGRLDCRCSSQQGSAAAISRDECMGYMQRGIFDPARSDQDAKAQNIAMLDRRDQNPGEGSTAAVPGEASGASDASRPGNGS